MQSRGEAAAELNRVWRANPSKYRVKSGAGDSCRLKSCSLRWSRVNGGGRLRADVHKMINLNFSVFTITY